MSHLLHLCFCFCRVDCYLFMVRFSGLGSLGICERGGKVCERTIWNLSFGWDCRDTHSVDENVDAVAKATLVRSERCTWVNGRAETWTDTTGPGTVAHLYGWSEEQVVFAFFPFFSFFFSFALFFAFFFVFNLGPHRVYRSLASPLVAHTQESTWFRQLWAYGMWVEAGAGS